MKEQMTQGSTKNHSKSANDTPSKLGPYKHPDLD
jgi:hypothetical protein